MNDQEQNRDDLTGGYSRLHDIPIDVTDSVTHDEFVAGVLDRTIGFEVMWGEPITLVRGARKTIFNILVGLYLVAPSLILPFWAYHESNWWLLLGIPIASVVAPQACALEKFGLTKGCSIGALLVLACIGFWVCCGIHNYFTFCSLCGLWGYVSFRTAEETQNEYAMQSLMESPELFSAAIAEKRIRIVRKANRMLWNVAEHTDEENQRYCWLRAIEWDAWPLFIAQPFIPPLLFFAAPGTLLVSLVIAGWVWALVRYQFADVRLAHVGGLAVSFLKWPSAWICGGLFLARAQYGLAALSAFWPLVTMGLALLMPGGLIGVIEKKFIAQLLGVPESSLLEESRPDRPFSVASYLTPLFFLTLVCGAWYLWARLRPDPPSHPPPLAASNAIGEAGWPEFSASEVTVHTPEAFS